MFPALKWSGGFWFCFVFYFHYAVSEFCFPVWQSRYWKSSHQYVQVCLYSRTRTRACCRTRQPRPSHTTSAQWGTLCCDHCGGCLNQPPCLHPLTLLAPQPHQEKLSMLWKNCNNYLERLREKMTYKKVKWPHVLVAITRFDTLSFALAMLLSLPLSSFTVSILTLLKPKQALLPKRDSTVDWLISGGFPPCDTKLSSDETLVLKQDSVKIYFHISFNIWKHEGGMIYNMGSTYNVIFPLLTQWVREKKSLFMRQNFFE